MITAQPSKSTQNSTQDILFKPGRSSFLVNFRLREKLSLKHARADFSLFCTYFQPILEKLKSQNANSNLHCSFGISRNFWNQLFPNTTPPEQLKTFTEIKGDSFTAPSTPGDLFLHIRAEHTDVCYELLKQYMHFLNPFLENIYEIHGFSYVDGRSIIGFTGGNTPIIDAEVERAVVIGDEDAAYKGGSYLFTQQYLHDMVAWEGLTIEEQEKVIGKRKFKNLELFKDEKYSNAHNTVAQQIKEKYGNPLKILRSTIVFSNPSQQEFGTFFLSYSRRFEVIEKMLEQMFLGENQHSHDKLLEFSTPSTGTLFFIPSLQLITKFAQLALD